MHEIDEKVDRLARLAASRRLGGILLNTQPNFAWLTGGRSNQIDGSRENGSGSLLVSARGERFVVANNIEMPRLQEEALAGLGFSPREYLWTQEQAESGHADRHARRPRCAARSAATTRCRAARRWRLRSRRRARRSRRPKSIATARSAATSAALSATCAERSFRTSRKSRSRSAWPRAWRASARRAIVTLVAADDRMGRFRHPVPTPAQWHQQVMVVVCAQRQGLVAALSRIVVAGRVPDALEARTAATAERLRAAARRDDARRHRRGALSGGGARLRRRRVSVRRIAPSPGRGHGLSLARVDRAPASRDTVQARQAFAWNPSVTGTKVEETMLVHERGLRGADDEPGLAGDSAERRRPGCSPRPRSCRFRRLGRSFPVTPPSFPLDTTPCAGIICPIISQY